MALISKRSVVYIVQAAVSTSISDQINLSSYVNNYAFQVSITGSSTVSASVALEFSNDGIYFFSDEISILYVSGINVAGGGFVNTGNWNYCRANILSITGPDAVVTVTVGVIN